MGGWPRPAGRPSSGATAGRSSVPSLEDALAAPIWTARLLALAGFLDAAYLTVHHYSGQAVACGPGGGCELVLSSEYAVVWGVPVAAMGLAYYALASLFAWTPRDAWTRGIAVGFVALEGAALAMSGVFIWIQAARIGSWCRFCLASAAITLLLFAAALWILRTLGTEGARSGVEPGA